MFLFFPNIFDVFFYKRRYFNVLAWFLRFDAFLHTRRSKTIAHLGQDHPWADARIRRSFPDARAKNKCLLAWSISFPPDIIQKALSWPRGFSPCQVPLMAANLWCRMKGSLQRYSNTCTRIRPTPSKPFLKRQALGTTSSCADGASWTLDGS